MIRINLLGDDTVRDNTGQLVLAGYGASVVLFLLIFATMQHFMNSGIKELVAKQQELQTELDRLTKITVEVRDLESKEKEYNEKLLVIGRLKKSKTGPVRVLDDLNKAIPERAWLTGMKEQGGVLRLEGRALDNQTIAVLMKDLDTSTFFDAVDLVETKQIEDNKGVKFKEFVLSTNVSYTGLGAIKAKEEASADEPNAGGAPPVPEAPLPGDKEAVSLAPLGLKRVS